MNYIASEDVRTGRPAFAVRGGLPHASFYFSFLFLCGPGVFYELAVSCWHIKLAFAPPPISRGGAPQHRSLKRKGEKRACFVVFHSHICVASFAFWGVCHDFVAFF